MNRFNKALSLSAISLCAYCFIPAASALQSDRSQAITIDADSAERDEQAGTTTYSGKVEMAQGSMRIQADKIIIYSSKDKVSKIVASGKPAKYEQKPNEKDGKVIASANILEYRIDEESLRLIEQASLNQEGTSLSGSSIEYDVRKSVVKAGSNQTKKQRVRMVIPPKAIRNNDETENNDGVDNNNATENNNDANENTTDTPEKNSSDDAL